MDFFSAPAPVAADMQPVVAAASDTDAPAAPAADVAVSEPVASSVGAAEAPREMDFF
eukprot:COSAG02_NODE_48597_length_332_cov_1.253219_2_plen_56_part_01